MTRARGGFQLAVDRESTSHRARRAYMVTSICFGLGLLGFFKYFNFFLDTVNTAASVLPDVAGISFPPLTTSLAIVLPAGISFYTFETIRYTIDVYRRHIEPERDFWYFACFVSLFPHLIAGPIIKPGDLIPQLHALESRHRWRCNALLSVRVRPGQESPARGSNRQSIDPISSTWRPCRRRRHGSACWVLPCRSISTSAATPTWHGASDT